MIIVKKEIYDGIPFIRWIKNPISVNFEVDDINNYYRILLTSVFRIIVKQH